MTINIKKYKFKFLDPKVEEYFFNNVIDPNRMSTKECIAKGLPYVDNEGHIKNTHAFKEASLFYEKHRKYCLDPEPSKANKEFWAEEKKRCLEGLWLGQVRIPGYFYFFLNYFSMTLVDKSTKMTRVSRPYFYLSHFNFFHILEYCFKHKYNLPLIKPRSVGLTEAATATGVCDFFVYSKDQYGERIFRNHTYFASEKFYLHATDAILNKALISIEWLNGKGDRRMYQPLGHTVKPSDLLLIPGYRSKSTNLPVQTGGAIKGKTLVNKDDPRSGRSEFVWWEESGANNILSEALQVALSLSDRAGEKSGIHVIWGTSNADPRGIDAFKKVLSSPFAYECLGFKNVWKGFDQCQSLEEAKEFMDKVPLYAMEYMYTEPNPDAKGWFLSTLDSHGLDLEGNPQRLKKYDELMKTRRLKIEASTGDNDVMSAIADKPITMEEALYKKGTEFFDRNLLAVQYQALTLHKELPLPIRGNLTYSKSKNSYTFNQDNKGKIQMIEEPELNPLGKPYENLYIIGYDGIDAGVLSSQTGSNGSKMCAIVYQRIKGVTGCKPVAMYLERPDDERDGYDVVLQLAEWYNAQICIEDTKRGIFTYARERGQSNLFYGRPRIARKDMVKYKKDATIGVPGSEKFILHGLELLKHYIKDHSENLYFPELVKQALEYTYEDKSKYDTIAAFSMALIADEDLRPVTIKEVEQGKKLIGYYRDSRGRKRHGIIPESDNIKVGDIRDFHYDINGKKIYE